MLKQVHLKFLRHTLVGALAVGGVAACGDSDDSTPQPPMQPTGDSNPDVTMLPPTIPSANSGSSGFDDVLGQQLAALDAAQCVWTSTGGIFTINLSATKNVAIVSLDATSTNVLVNDVPCNATGAAIVAADMKILNINGSTAADVAVLDYANGFFGLGATGAPNVNNGTNFDLKASPAMTSDRVLIRMKAAADKVICGSSGTTYMCNVNSDGMGGTEGNIVDIKKFLAVELVQFGMGEDDDVFTGAGSAGITGLAGTWGTTPFGVPLIVNGGDGADTLTGGNGADTILGWVGDDTINAEAAKTGGNDIYSGGTGTADVLTYASRTAALTIQNDTTWGMATATDVSGESGESDRIQNDFETYIGGSGNDTFKMGLDATSTYDATYNGGAGVDTADYSARTTAITIKLADDTATTGNGDVAGGNTENDSLQNMEGCLGSSGVDTITGSAGDDTIDGRGGNDAITAGAGNDTIIEGSLATGVLSGTDEITGGDGFDTISYEGRSGAVTVTLALVGAGTGNDGDGTGPENDDVYLVERVIGTAQADTLTAAAQVAPAGNVLEGLAGDDTLTGGTGNDRLEGGDGTDVYSGGCGAGDDTIIDAQDITLANLATWLCENKI